MLKTHKRFENGVLVEEYEVDVPVRVPQSVAPNNARKAIRAAGLKPAVDAWLATQSEDVQDDWEYAVEIRRDSPTVEAAQIALGLTDAQMDALFVSAGAL